MYTLDTFVNIGQSCFLHGFLPVRVFWFLQGYFGQCEIFFFWVLLSLDQKQSKVTTIYLFLDIYKTKLQIIVGTCSIQILTVNI